MNKLKFLKNGFFKGKMLKIKIIAFIILIVFLLLPCAIFYLKIEVDGKYIKDDSSNVPFVVDDDYIANAKFGSDGIYFEKTNEDGTKTKITIDDIWKKLKGNKSRIKYYLKNAEELEKLVNAEVVTQFPKLGLSDDKLDGTIEFERHKMDGTSKKLKYVDEDTFNDYIDKKDTNAVDYFTINEDGDLLIAVVDKTTEELTQNDKDMELSDYTDTMSERDMDASGNYKSVEYSVVARKVNYKNAISKYTMPFEYLWAFIVISEDKEFSFELADLAKNSEITISIYDNVTTTVNTDVYTYKRERKTDTYVKVAPAADYGVAGYPAERRWADGSEYPSDYNIDDTDYKVTHTMTYETNTPVLDVTKADVWIVDYSKEYKYQSNAAKTEDTNHKELDDTDYKEDKNSPINSNQDASLLSNGHAIELQEECRNYIQTQVNSREEAARSAAQSSKPKNSTEVTVIPHTTVSVNIEYVECNYYSHQIDRTQDTNTTESKQEYVESTVKNRPKVEKDYDEDNFVTILSSTRHRNGKENILETTSWLFYILAENDATNNMVDLTKYLLYKVTGKDYGITEYNFGEYESTSFSMATSGIYGNSIQEKVWFALKGLGYSDYAAAGAMGNIHYESGGFSSSAVEKSTGNGIGLCQWSFGRRTQLERYATSKGLQWQDEDIQVAFLIGELTKGGGADGFANYQLMNTTVFYGSSLATPSSWENAKNIEDSTRAFCYTFERPDKGAAATSMSRRVSYAQQYYDEFNGKSAPEEIEGSELTGDNKTKMGQMVSEAIRIADDDRYTYSQAFRESEYSYDCSSFVSRLYQRFFGIPRLDAGTLGRGTDNIRANCEAKYREVSMTALQPGDILWRDGHVALYIGNNQTAEASSPTSGIKVKTVGNFTKAFRVVF